MKYDITLKEIIGKLPAVFIREVLGLDATHDVVALQVDLSFSSHREPDLIFTLEDKLVHIELQTKNDKDMPIRMLEYFTLLTLYCKNTLKKDYQIVQFVIYTGEEPLRMESGLELPNISYRYNLIDMRSVSCKKLLQEPSDEAFMLAVLCDIDTDTFSKEFLNRIKGKDEKALKEFEAKMLNLLNLRPKLFQEFKRISQEVINMPIPIAETPLYQEGLKEGFEKGRLEGKIEGKLETLINLVKLKYGYITPSLLEKINSITEEETYNRYLTAFIQSQTLEEFLEKIK